MKTPSRTLIALVASLFAACGGGGSSNGEVVVDDMSTEPVDVDPDAPSEPTDPEPTESDLAVDAGYGRIAGVGREIQLIATVEGSAEPTLLWSQVSGTEVSLRDPETATPSFVTPVILEPEMLVFELTADDGAGTASDRVVVEVWIPADGEADPTQLGDFSGFEPWACDVDPVSSPELTIEVSDSSIVYSGNGIPDHATGTFPNNGNPNAIQASPRTFEIPRTPALTEEPTPMAEFGITLDGVKLERDTAESYRNEGQWRYEAVTPGLALGSTADAEFRWLGTDCNNAHVQPTGAYHYHGLPEGLINRLGEGTSEPEMILGGYAADGHPFYLRYGYADPMDASSGLVVVQASWELREGTRDSGPGGSFDGTFREDWEFVADSGDLDECGGRFGVTPEYPDGTYHYYLTDDYPYIPRCVLGVPSDSFRAMGGGPMP